MFDRKTLRGRINLTIGLVMVGTAVLFGTFVALYEVRRRNDALQQIELSLRDLTTQYKSQLGNEIFAAHLLAIKESLKEVKQRNGVLAIATFDDSGAPVTGLDERNNDASPAEALTQAMMTGAYAVVENWKGHSVLTFTSPLMAYGETAGFWRIRYSLKRLNTQTYEVVVIFSLLILLPFSLVFFLVNRILDRFVWRPVYQLRDTMQIVRGIEDQTFTEQSRDQGFESVDQMIRAVDTLLDERFKSQSRENEISSLAHSFRHMLAELKKAYIGSRTDVLTRLSNRLKLDEVLQAEISKAGRQRAAFSVLLLDLDLFKSINDTYGHLAGDQVLKQLADLLRGFFRKGDTPGRWGGEEFLVLLPTLDLAQACLVAERLRKSIASTSFEGVGPCTASIGVAQYRSGESLEELISRVDGALYKAKESGRNRVEPAG